MTPQMTISPLKDLDGFITDWKSLNGDRPAASFFQSEAWVSSWLKLAQSQTDLMQFRVTDQNGLAMLGYLGQRNVQSVPVAGIKELRLSEAANENVDTLYVEYNDFQVRSDADSDLRRHALVYLFENMSGPDSFIFRNIVPRLRHSVFSACTARGWKPRVIHEGATFAIKLLHLREDNQSILDKVSSNTRRQIERSMRLYEERGELSVHRALSDAERESCWQSLEEMHTKAWVARGETGSFASKNFQLFHKNLRDHYGDALDFLTIKAGDETIGCFYNFLHNRMVLNYQSGFKYEKNNQLKPGLVSHTLAAQYYLKNDYDVYDMLVGDARYKQSLGEPFERLSVIEVERPCLKQKARNFARHVRSKVKPS